jgi:hypothetical protein
MCVAVVKHVAHYLQLHIVSLAHVLKIIFKAMDQMWCQIATVMVLRDVLKPTGVEELWGHHLRHLTH